MSIKSSKNIIETLINRILALVRGFLKNNLTTNMVKCTIKLAKILQSLLVMMTLKDSGDKTSDQSKTPTYSLPVLKILGQG